MDETLRLTNPTPDVVSLPDFECGFTRLLKDESGSIPLAEIGLDPARAYVFDEAWVSCADGKLIVKAALGPWGAKMASAEGR